MYSSRSYKKPNSNARRWQIGAVAGVAVAIVGVGLGVASADEAVPTVNCPAVNINVAVPAQAQAEVQSNLQLLNTQINEANNRLKTSVGQGGANFIQNAILGPLADKRFATINRMETAIGRNAAKPDLNAEGLKTCTLNQGGGASAAQPTAVPSAATGGNAAGGGNNSAVGNISCPQVNVNVAVPASAADEVKRNLELLNTQISEAQNRLNNSVGQGGANFVQNAILGPLADKRFATINRIETAIGRRAAKPDLNAEGLKTCTVSQSAGAAQNTGVSVADQAAVAAAAGKIVCPAVNINVAVPAQAAAEVQRNLDLLNTQIAESQKRLESSVGQGGANFVQNAILGPLADKRNSTINRIETAIGRNAAKPDLNAEGLKTCAVQK